MRFINNEQFEFYWGNGYLVIEKFFSCGEVEIFYESAKKVATSDYKTLLNLDREEDILKQNPDSNKEDREALAKLVKWVQFHPRMVGILEELYKREMATLQSIILFKENGSPYQSTAWNPHQDNAYVQNKNNLYLAVVILFMNFLRIMGDFIFTRDRTKKGSCPMSIMKMQQSVR